MNITFSSGGKKTTRRGVVSWMGQCCATNRGFASCMGADCWRWLPPAARCRSWGAASTCSVRCRVAEAAVDDVDVMRAVWVGGSTERAWHSMGCDACPHNCNGNNRNTVAGVVSRLMTRLSRVILLKGLSLLPFFQTTYLLVRLRSDFFRLSCGFARVLLHGRCRWHPGTVVSTRW